jgi:hypothetical protein
MESLPNLILSDPLLTGAVTVAVLALVAWQRTLTYSEYLGAHRIKTIVFRVLDPIFRRRGRPLIRWKKYNKNDAEYVRWTPESPRKVGKIIQSDFTPHLIATAKYRDIPRGTQPAHSQYRQLHDDGAQTELILFAGIDGGTDVYAHVETSVEDVEGHLTDKQFQGDARAAFKQAYLGRVDDDA